MSDNEKGKLIGAIILELHLSGQDFDEGDTFFSLCFKSDDELKQIARLCKVS